MFISQVDFQRSIYSPCDVHTTVGYRHMKTCFDTSKRKTS